MRDQLYEETSDKARNNKHYFVASLRYICFFICYGMCNKTRLCIGCGFVVLSMLLSPL